MVIPEFPSDNPDLWLARAADHPETADRSDPNDLPVETASEEIRVEEAIPAPAVVTEPDRSDPNDPPSPELEIEVVDFDEGDFALVEDGSIPPPAPPPPASDPFQRFVSTLVEVALASGAPARVVGALPGMLGTARLDVSPLDEPTLDALVAAGLLARSDTGAVIRSPNLVTNAQAWRAIVAGEETDLPVTEMLDEWSAHLVAALARVPQQKEAVRRELRARGIAAFGLLDAA